MSRKCGNCIHSQQERPYGEWVCGNEESEAYGLDIAYDDVCEEWEGKDE